MQSCFTVMYRVMLMVIQMEMQLKVAADVTGKVVKLVL